MDTRLACPLLALFLFLSSVLTGCGGSGNASSALTRAQDAFVTMNGVRRHYIDHGGKGQTLLLLSGIGDNAHIFDDLAPKLTGEYRVLALTRRGFGQSDQPPTGYDVDSLTDDIRMFLDSVGAIGKVHIAGHSLAGMEMTRFAARFPERVGKLIYLDAAYDYSLATGSTEPGQEPEPPQLPPGVSEDDIKALMPPSPTAEDFASLENARKFIRSQHSVWSNAMDRSFRDAVLLLPDGSVAPRTGEEITQGLIAASQQYKPEWNKVTAPALLIVPLPGRVQHMFPHLPETMSEGVRMLAEMSLQGDIAAKQMQAEMFRQQAANARIAEIADSEHYVFVNHLEETARQMRDFLKAT
ncbi:MAG: hypothetical protein OHK0029_34420 [Armatimonadaceae bacterium]